ncbi:MAG: sigma-70 family RNA polymerase sigma factor [Saprospiraceae bacterium]|nr:sigma-70 family RNA polymerase sigma factor [Saprospiraceae bacterium]
MAGWKTLKTWYRKCSWPLIGIKDQYRGQATERTWLAAIIGHKVMDFYRRQKPEKPFSAYLEESQPSFDQHFFDQSNYGHWIHNIGPNYLSNQADSQVLSTEFRQALEFCLSKLPSRLKAVFMAKYFDEIESMEICREFEISDKNFWVIIFRAKTIFRKCLAKNEMI